MMRTYKDIKKIKTWFTDEPTKTWNNVKSDDVIELVKEHIKHLEKESGEYLTDHLHGYWQAQAIRKIFNLKDWYCDE